jgi:hypothetical protein
LSQAAPRRPSRGAPRFGGAPAWEGARWCWEGRRDCVEPRGRHWTGRRELEEGVLGSGRTGSASARAAVCVVPPVRCLYRRARQRDAALMPPHGASLGRRAQHGSATDHRVVRSSPYGVVRRCSRVPRMAGAKGTTTLTSRRWGTSRTDVEAGATPGARRVAQTSPAERQARRRRSGARPSRF